MSWVDPDHTRNGMGFTRDHDFLLATRVVGGNMQIAIALRQRRVRY